MSLEQVNEKVMIVNLMDFYNLCDENCNIEEFATWIYNLMIANPNIGDNEKQEMLSSLFSPRFLREVKATQLDKFISYDFAKQLILNRVKEASHQFVYFEQRRHESEKAEDKFDRANIQIRWVDRIFSSMITAYAAASITISTLKTGKFEAIEKFKAIVNAYPETIDRLLQQLVREYDFGEPDFDFNGYADLVVFLLVKGAKTMQGENQIHILRPLLGGRRLYSDNIIDSVNHILQTGYYTPTLYDLDLVTWPNDEDEFGMPAKAEDFELRRQVADMLLSHNVPLQDEKGKSIFTRHMHLDMMNHIYQWVKNNGQEELINVEDAKGILPVMKASFYNIKWFLNNPNVRLVNSKGQSVLYHTIRRNLTLVALIIVEWMEDKYFPKNENATRQEWKRALDHVASLLNIKGGSDIVGQMFRRQRSGKPDFLAVLFFLVLIGADVDMNLVSNMCPNCVETVKAALDFREDIERDYLNRSTESKVGWSILKPRLGRDVTKLLRTHTRREELCQIMTDNFGVAELRALARFANLDPGLEYNKARLCTMLSAHITK